MDDKQKKRELLEKARGIVDKAEAAGRDLTATEMNEVNGLLKSAKQIDGDNALRKALDELGVGVGGSMRGDGSGAAWPSMRGAGAWSKTVIGLGRKALLTPSGAVGVATLSSVLPAIGEKLDSVLQVLPAQPTGDNASIKYLREDTRTHAADTVAEGAEKPESDYELSEQVAPARTIAHLSKPAPRQWFTDTAGGLQRYLDFVMRQGLQLALEDQVLYGSGAGADLDGMFHVSGHLVQSYDTSMLKTCRKAITILQVAGVLQTNMVFVMHPDDWEAIELLESSSGVYALNGGQENNLPVELAARRLWGCPVALSTGMTEGMGGLFDRTAVGLYEHEQVTLSWSENTYNPNTQLSDFQTNQMRWRAEGRWALAVYRPSACIEVELVPSS